jgi:hypothetical protein
MCSVALYLLNVKMHLLGICVASVVFVFQFQLVYTETDLTNSQVCYV